MILLIFLLWNGVWWAIIGSLIHGQIPGGWWGVLLLALVCLAPLAILVAGFRGALYPAAAVRLWMLRPFWYVQLLLPLLGMSGLAGAAIGLLFGMAGPSGRWAMAGAACLAIVLVVWGYVGSRRLVVRELDIESPRLPAGLEGLRIVQLSDIHIGPHTSRAHILRIKEAARRASPDLIVFTGDQVDDFAQDVAIFAAAFGDLVARPDPHTTSTGSSAHSHTESATRSHTEPAGTAHTESSAHSHTEPAAPARTESSAHSTARLATLGVYAVAGNHDVYAGWSEVRQGLEQMGITVLVNDAVPLRRNESELWVAGTGDPSARSWEGGGGRSAAPNVDRALAGIPDGAFVIALAHNPSLWPELAARGTDVTLSGHTHHGQFSIPRLGWSLASPFVKHPMGLYREKSAILYVSPGTNFWALPLRIGALPEVTVLTLRRAR